MNKRKKSRLGLLVMMCLLAYFGWVMFNQQKIIFAKQNDIKNIEVRMEEERINNQDLNKQKEMINTDEYVEKVAREKLGMVKPGEKVFMDVNK